MTKIFNLHMLVKHCTLLAFLPLLLTACKDDKAGDDSCEKWEYEGTTGPDHWVSLCDDYLDCGGMLQSPVDISAPVLDATLSPLHLSYQPVETEIEYNGHTVEFVTDQADGKLTLNGLDYHLLQFHFHTQSEHTLNGQHAPLELHLVHQEPLTKNRAVVGIMIQEGAENAFLAQFMSHLPDATNTLYTSTDEYNPVDVLPSDKSYYTYPGSLTTPSCDQNVSWFVLKTPVTASADQLARFEEIMHHNYRPIQPLSGRTVKLYQQ